jgi:FtsX-like permease family
VIARLVLASLRRRPRQLALILVAVMVAAGTVATMAGFAERADRRLGAGLAAFGPNLEVRPQVGGAASMPPDALVVVRSVPGVLAATPVALLPALPAPPALPAAPARQTPAEPQLARIEVRAEPARLAAVARAIGGRLEGVEVTPLLKTAASDARISHRLTLVLVAISGVSFLLAVLSVGAATTALVGERRVEVGLMLALGYSGRRIGGMLAAELLAVALVAALTGELLGEIAAGGLSSRLLGGTAGLQPTWTGLAAAVGVALVVVGLSLSAALARIERLDAAGVLRGE